MNDKKLENDLRHFDGHAIIRELKNNCSEITTGPGIYMVFRSNKEGRPEFLSKGSGGSHKGKDLNYFVEELEAKWIENENILYIGKTDDSLRSRIRTYMKFGTGKDVPHRGGRAIWQLLDSDDLIVAWKELPKTVSAREIEAKLIQEFKDAHNGKHPFANWVD